MANEIQELKFQVGEAWKGVYSSSTAYGLANVVQDPTGLSIYRSLKSGNVGHPLSNASWWFRIIDLSSIKAESDRIAALNQSIAQDEALRVAAEELRQQHEAERVAAETQRDEAEQARISAEQQRVNKESQREAAEQQRISAEQGRVSAESARVQAEQARVLAETLRANAEDQRAANEQNRIAAEQQRIERAEQDHQRAESDHATYVDSLGAFDISSYHATDGVLAKYADLTAALGTGGANIPDDLRKGGMSVKFVQSSDNKYVQFRYLLEYANTTAGNEAFVNPKNWQGVDDEPTAGSDNLVKSGGVEKQLPIFNIVGNGNSIKDSSNYTVKAGNKYRIWVKNTDISYAGITTTGNYLILSVRPFDQSGERIGTADIITVYKNDGLSNYYDFITPDNTEYIVIKMRAAVGAVLTIFIEDITVSAGLKEEIEAVGLELDSKVDNKYDNIIDVSKIVTGAGFNKLGQVMTNPSWNDFGLIVLPWEGHSNISVYKVTRLIDGLFTVQLDANRTFISGTAYGGSDAYEVHTFERAEGAVYLGVTLFLNDPLPPHANYGTTITNDTDTPNPIKGYLGGYATSEEVSELEEEIEQIANTSIVKLYAYADGSYTNDDDTHFYGWKDNKCSIQRAIDAANGKTKTEIYCFGTFKATAASQFFLGSNAYYNIVFIPAAKSNIEIIGEGIDRTVISADMPADSNYCTNYQPMEIWGNNCIVRNLSIYSKNSRYCIHMDNSGGRTSDGFTISFYDVKMFHYNNSNQSYEGPFGLGISDGMTLITERCIFGTSRNYVQPLYLHDNVDFKKPFIWKIKECSVEKTSIVGNKTMEQLMNIQTLGSNVKGNIVIEDFEAGHVSYLFKCENNNTSSKTQLDEYDANIFVPIHGETSHPVGYITENSTSACLRITSKSTGTTSKVRFDKTSSAFDIIIKGLLATGYTEANGIVHTDGYQYRDGVAGVDDMPAFSGYAMGELAVDKNRICSIQKRLGDCSSSNKQLIVSIDDVDYTITFNQDYTNYSDADMLSVFTNVIGSVANVELYNWGADYFPEIPNCTTKDYNNQSYVIPKGYGVKRIANGVMPATNDNELYGIALEDIYPGCVGKIGTHVHLSMFADDHHYVAMESRPNRGDNSMYQTEFQGQFGIGSHRGVFEKVDGGILNVYYYSWLTLGKL